jgi:acid phosphatase type 7
VTLTTRTGLRLVAMAAALATAATDARAAGSVTKGPWVQRVTRDSAVVRVEVDPPSPVTLELGPGAGGPADDGGHRVFESPEARSLHTIPLTNLQPATRYTYAVRAGATSKPAAFVTAPPDDGDVPFRFLVYGDNRTDAAGHAAVVRAMAPAGADFLVHTGDFVENGGSAAHWQTFFEVEAPLLGSRCIFSCVGNHELTDGAGIQYTRFFGPTDPPASGVRPEHLNGTFRWGNTRFFFINGMVSYKATADRAWLEKELVAAEDEKSLKWRVVVVHHGPWSSGPHGNNARLHDAGIVSLLKAHKIDLILSGHDHIYERGWTDGLAYVVSGGGGAPVYKIKSRLPTTRTAESVHHFVDINVSASTMQLVATRVDGSTIERCALEKGILGWSCDGAAAVPAAGSSASSPSASAAPSSLGPSRCACDVVGTPSPSSAALSLASMAAVVLALSRRRRC